MCHPERVLPFNSSTGPVQRTFNSREATVSAQSGEAYLAGAETGLPRLCQPSWDFEGLSGITAARKPVPHFSGFIMPQEGGALTENYPITTPVNNRFNARSDPERAQRAQEDLLESRETLLVKRADLRRQRGKLHDLRVKAGESEAAFMSELRQLSAEHGALFSRRLFGLFEEVQAAREQLGAKDEDYNQAETSYNRFEYRFGERETDFYRELVDLHGETTRPDRTPPKVPFELSQASAATNMHSTPLSSHTKEPMNKTTVEYLDALGEEEMLREQLDELRHERAEQLDDRDYRQNHNMPVTAENQQFLEQVDGIYLDILDQLLVAEQRAGHLRQRLFEGPTDVILERRASDPFSSNNPGYPSMTQDMTRRAQSESALANSVFPWKARVNEWLLDFLRNSSLERIRQKNDVMALPERGGLDDAGWCAVLRDILQNSIGDSLPFPPPPKSESNAQLGSNLTASGHMSLERKSPSPRVHTPNPVNYSMIPTAYSDPLGPDAWQRRKDAQVSSSSDPGLSVPPQHIKELSGHFGWIEIGNAHSESNAAIDHSVWQCPSPSHHAIGPQPIREGSFRRRKKLPPEGPQTELPSPHF